MGELTALAPSTENQGRGPSRAQVLGVDRWLHPVLAEHLPADVDLQGRVRRVRPNHRPQEVLLSASCANHVQSFRWLSGAFAGLSWPACRIDCPGTPRFMLATS